MTKKDIKRINAALVNGLDSANAYAKQLLAANAEAAELIEELQTVNNELKNHIKMIAKNPEEPAINSPKITETILAAKAEYDLLEKQMDEPTVPSSAIAQSLAYFLKRLD